MLSLKMTKKNDQKPRHTYSINIPRDATPEEIKEFMKEFLKHWGKDPNEQPSKQEPE